MSEVVSIIPRIEAQHRVERRRFMRWYAGRERALVREWLGLQSLVWKLGVPWESGFVRYSWQWQDRQITLPHTNKRVLADVTCDGFTDHTGRQLALRALRAMYPLAGRGLVLFPTPEIQASMQHINNATATYCVFVSPYDGSESVCYRAEGPYAVSPDLVGSARSIALDELCAEEGFAAVRESAGAEFSRRIGAVGCVRTVLSSLRSSPPAAVIAYE